MRANFGLTGLTTAVGFFLAAAFLGLSCAETSAGLSPASPKGADVSEAPAAEVEAPQPPAEEVPKTPEEILREIEALLSEGRETDALAVSQKISPDLPESTRASLALGKWAREQRRGKEAMRRLTDACTSATGGTLKEVCQELIWGMSLPDVTANDAESALPCFRRLAESEPELPEARKFLAQAHIHAEEFAAARRELSGFLLLRPDDAETYALLSGASLAQGARGEAILFARRALELAPDAPLAHKSLALSLIAPTAFSSAQSAASAASAKATGERDAEAMHHLSLCLKGLPDDAEVWKARAVLSLKYRDGAEAERSCLRLEALEGKTPKTALCLAWAIEAETASGGKSRIEEAVRHYQQAMAGSEKGIAIDAALGLAALKEGPLKSPKEALPLYEQALSAMDEGDARRENAQKALAKIKSRLEAEAALENASGDNGAP